jgi:hypothetical protein
MEARWRNSSTRKSRGKPIVYTTSDAVAAGFNDS